MVTYSTYNRVMWHNNYTSWKLYLASYLRKHVKKQQDKTTNKLTMKSTYIVVKQGLKQRNKELIFKKTWHVEQKTKHEENEENWASLQLNKWKRKEKKQQNKNKIQRNVPKHITKSECRNL
jgi:hypothetical protein